ncbi:hypothetical protein IEQ34_023190 [Dendrobium chrysotoxum]|uniref:ATP synthase protein MI25 n=1 Tax=Dendrobium chrysotoxum TaxID=161865 RepID=A0AAV7FX52_DENCH|nr:hypothetical protein IEQ34_023190 [Dendrobium chrysotoxum]
MRLSSTKMLDRKMLFAAIPSICASSPKKISIYNEEMIVARCFIGFLIFSRKSLGQTFKVTLDGRIQSIQEESQQFPNPNEVVPSESNEQQRLLRISLRICGTVVESLPTARSAPKCEKTVQALLCRNLNVKSATLLNATSSRRIRLQDDIVTGFHFSVSERFVPGCTLKASIVELLREGLVVLRKVFHPVERCDEPSACSWGHGIDRNNGRRNRLKVEWASVLTAPAGLGTVDESGLAPLPPVGS